MNKQSFSSNKLIPFTEFSKKAARLSSLSNTSAVVDRNGVPLGFVFGRDSFISFLEYLDEQFEKKVKNPKEAFDNPAGKLIDTIEEKLPVNPEFMKTLKSSVVNSKQSGWIPLKEVLRALHV